MNNIRDKEPLFPATADGLGTFLAIAADRIHQWAADGRLEPHHIDVLRRQADTALFNMGAAFELLAMERIDYTTDSDTSAVTAALTIAGRAMMELAKIGFSLKSAEHANERRRQTADSDGWPPC